MPSWTLATRQHPSPPAQRCKAAACTGCRLTTLTHWRHCWDYLHTLLTATTHLLTSGRYGWLAWVVVSTLSLTRHTLHQVPLLLGLLSATPSAAAQAGEAFMHALPLKAALASVEWKEATWLGKPNLLSSSHVAWPIVQRAQAACWRTPAATSTATATVATTPALPSLGTTMSAGTALRTRRSALDFDASHAMPLPQFVAAMAAAATQQHHGLTLVPYIVNVDTLQPGIYCLTPSASADALTLARAALPHKDLQWQRVALPKAATFALYLLRPLTRAAMGDTLVDSIICGQSLVKR